jgi:hypothetical protein
LLARIADEHAGSALVAQALFDRARIAFQQRAWSRALRQLDRLAALGSSPLAEPGAFLACRVALAAGDEGAERCLTDYRTAYPRSPHDLEVLGALADLAYRTGGCPATSAQRDELFRRFPASALARTWAERCREAR